MWDSLTAVQLLFKCIQIFFQRDLHPDEAGAGHHAGRQYDEQ